MFCEHDSSPGWQLCCVLGTSRLQTDACLFSLLSLSFSLQGKEVKESVLPSSNLFYFLNFRLPCKIFWAFVAVRSRTLDSCPPQSANPTDFFPVPLHQKHCAIGLSTIRPCRRLDRLHRCWRGFTFLWPVSSGSDLLRDIIIIVFYFLTLTRNAHPRPNQPSVSACTLQDSNFHWSIAPNTWWHFEHNCSSIKKEKITKRRKKPLILYNAHVFTFNHPCRCNLSLCFNATPPILGNYFLLGFFNDCGWLIALFERLIPLVFLLRHKVLVQD